MNNFFHNHHGRKLLSGVLATLCVAQLSFFASCSDDHFDIDSQVSGRKTIWQNISGNENLSEYADILSRVRYSKTESSVTPQTYADLFNHEQTFTVWAPENGTFNYAYWSDLLDNGENYKVETELVRNNMTRFTHLVSGANTLKLDLFNNKSADFKFGDGEATIKDQRVVVPNVASSNGVVHVIDGAVPYMPNLYEYIFEAEGTNKMAEFFKLYEEVRFNENASTQGPTIDGNITWVDSVTSMTNSFVNGYLNARINSEDSCYAMVMLQDDAWELAYNDISRYFVFNKEYVQTISDGETSESVTTSYSQAELDSLTQFSINRTIARNLVFNVHNQHGQPYSNFNKPGMCDSLTNTVNNVYHDPVSATLFGSNDPVELSNGYAFVTNQYNYPAVGTWLDTLNFEAEYYDESVSSGTVNTDKYDKSISYVVETEEGMEKRDTLFSHSFLRVNPSRLTSNPSVTFRIPGTHSCKYDIYLVTVHNYDANLPYQFRVYLRYHELNQRDSKRIQLKPLEDDVHKNPKNAAYYISRMPWFDEKGNYNICDTIKLAEDYLLPVSYSAQSQAFATLEVNSYATGSDRSNYTNQLLIDKIILVPKPYDKPVATPEESE